MKTAEEFFKEKHTTDKNTEFIPFKIQTLNIYEIYKLMEEYAEQYCEEKTCEWEYDEEFCFYNTECDEAYQLEIGTLEENKHNYCPFCGGRIILTNKQ